MLKYKYTYHIMAEEQKMNNPFIKELEPGKAAEDRIAAQFARVLFWSRLAAILALPGALYVFWKIVCSIIR